MHVIVQTNGAPAEGPWLYVPELLHRIGNEYAVAIAATRLAASRSANVEVQAALGEVAGRLAAYANAHRIMQPLSADGATDLVEHLTQLCGALTRAGLHGRGIDLTLDISQPIFLEASRCWRVGLVICELITNASRHAFGIEGRGSIRVVLTATTDDVLCEVRDDGPGPVTFSRGVGSQLVGSLAAELGGRVERHCGPQGTIVRLMALRRPAPPLSRSPALCQHEDTASWSLPGGHESSALRDELHAGWTS